MDGAALAKRKLLGKPKLAPKAEDPDGVLAGRRAGSRPAAARPIPAKLKLKPSKEIQKLYAQAKARAWDLLAGALRGEWEPLNRDLETGGVPGAAHRPAGIAAVGYYYALAGAAADRGREAGDHEAAHPPRLRQLAPLPGPAAGRGRPAAPGAPAGAGAPAPTDFIPICLGPYGSREQALKVRVELTEAVRGAYRDATRKPSTAITLATEEPRLAL